VNEFGVGERSCGLRGRTSEKWVQVRHILSKNGRRTWISDASEGDWSYLGRPITHMQGACGREWSDCPENCCWLQQYCVWFHQKHISYKCCSKAHDDICFCR